MTKNIITLLLISMFVIVSSKNSKTEIKAENKHTPKDTIALVIPDGVDIPFTIANPYFVKNTVPQGQLENPKIETIEEFEKYFGSATTMGEDGKPTPIDFNMQFIIAVLGSDTDIETNIVPVSLQKNSQNQIVYTYKIETKGANRSFTIRPFSIIIVDKSNTGEVVLKQE